MSSRDKILARVKEALSVPTIRPEPHEGPVVDSSYADQVVDHQPRTHWMRDPGTTVEANLALFKELSEKLKTDVHEVASLVEAKERLGQLAKEHGWSRLGVHDGVLCNAVRDGFDGEWLETDGGYNVDEMEACQAGVSECEALIAQTASILVTSKSSGGRALSVLPPHHVVLATRDQLLPDLSAGYRLLAEKYNGDYPSLITFITGPSRTGDIERTLVLGAHGPKYLTLILIDNPNP